MPQELDLSENGIGDSGVRVLGRTLGQVRQSFIEPVCCTGQWMLRVAWLCAEQLQVRQESAVP